MAYFQGQILGFEEKITIRNVRNRVHGHGFSLITWHYQNEKKIGTQTPHFIFVDRTTILTESDCLKYHHFLSPTFWHKNFARRLKNSRRKN